MKSRIVQIAQKIAENGDRVEIPLCEEIHKLATDPAVPAEVAEKLRTIWWSSRCANGNLIRLALELLAATLTEKPAGACWLAIDNKQQVWGRGASFAEAVARMRLKGGKTRMPQLIRVEGDDKAGIDEAGRIYANRGATITTM